MAMQKKMKQLMAITTRGEGSNEKTFWTRIGVGFENNDGSYNLRFEFLPTHLVDTTIQLRDFKEKEEKE